MVIVKNNIINNLGTIKYKKSTKQLEFYNYDACYNVLYAEWNNYNGWLDTLLRDLLAFKNGTLPQEDIDILNKDISEELGWDYIEDDAIKWLIDREVIEILQKAKQKSWL